MIVGSIESWGKKYVHIETGLEIEIVKTDVQAKLTSDFGGKTSWTTCVAYARKGETNWFVVDVDSFRSKFKEVEGVVA